VVQTDLAEKKEKEKKLLEGKPAAYGVGFLKKKIQCFHVVGCVNQRPQSNSKAP
jgi:hypothetical protein